MGAGVAGEAIAFNQVGQGRTVRCEPRRARDSHHQQTRDDRNVA